MIEAVRDGVRGDDGDGDDGDGRDGDDGRDGRDTHSDDIGSRDTAANDAPESERQESDRLTRALHWAQQGSSPEVAQERWMRRIAGQSQQRLERDLTSEQVEDVAMVAAWVHAEAVAEGAALARKRMRRSAAVRFATTMLGAGIGALIAQVATQLTVL